MPDSDEVSASGSDEEELNNATEKSIVPTHVPCQLEAEEENVCVAVRVRPLTKSETQSKYKEVLIVNQLNNTIEIRNPSAKNKRKTFKFDAVFPTGTAQAELYNQIARPIVQNVIQGYNGTIFAYGQTGTGKTYTMDGDRSTPELKGILPNSFAQIFSHISNETGDTKFLVRVSYLEIYNEEVRDLLSKETLKKLDIKENESGVYVKGLSSFVVKSEKDMERILGIGKKNRAVAATSMNVESSRSHAIFTVTVECSTEEGGRQTLRMGKLNLVDLAGSERASKSGTSGARLKEGSKINLSLSCLGNVISALVDGKPHIPYRSSKLTRLLQDSLGGNSKTVMIANVGSADFNYDETMSTLRYANRAKRIKNHARINEDPKDAILRQFQNEIEALTKQLEEEDAKLRNMMISQPESCQEPENEEEAPLLPDEETLITGIKGELETQQKLSTTVQAEVEGKQSTLFRLKEDVLTWKQQQEKKVALQDQLLSIQKKIMVGGESLLDKSQEQEAYLQRCMAELNERRQEQSKLQDSLSSKIAEKVVSEDRILQLQAEHAQIQAEMKKWARILKAEELADEVVLEEEKSEREMLENEIGRLNYEICKDESIIETYIPKDALTAIKSKMTYNLSTERWNLQYKEFAGNNLKLAHPYSQGPRNYTNKKDLSYVYKSISQTNESKKDSGDEEGDHFRKQKDYISAQPVRTSKLMSHEESRKLLSDHDFIDPPTFHFMNFEGTDKVPISAKKKPLKF